MIAPSPASRMSARVTSPQALHRMSAAVANAAVPADRMLGSMSRRSLDSWQSPSLYYRPRIKLGGEWVPQEDLHGALEITEPELGSHTGNISFGLRGKRWSVAVSDTTWARTPVEIYLDHGPAGAVIEGEGTAVFEEGVLAAGVFAAETPAYRGYVLARPTQTPGPEPTVRVVCGDEAALYERYEMCDELAPKSGLTRGAIIALLAAGAGLGYSGPAGAVYDKPLQAARKRIFQLLPELAEPEGWQLEVKDGKVHVWNPTIKLAPLPPDWEWSPDDGSTLEIVPVAPEEAPSRWVLTATATVDTDERGVTTERTRVELADEYAPQAAEYRQDLTTGTPVATGLSQPSAELQVVSRVYLTELKRGEQVLVTHQEEWGWYYRRRARLVTDTSGSGTAGGGYDYTDAYIMPDGGYSAEARERFRELGRRRTVHRYDGSGTRLRAEIATDGWHRGGTKGVRAAGSPPSATTVVASYVYDDDQSYHLERETWGEVETITEQLVRDALGRVAETVQSTTRRQAIGSRVDGGSGYVLYDGTGQTEIVANVRLAQTVRTQKALTRDGLVAGETVWTSEYSAPVKVDGVYDWGSGKSNASEETFRVIASESKLYSTRGERQLSQETFPAEGGRVVNLILGQLPITEYTSSVWTRITAQPLELVVEDPLAEARWGWQRETLSHDHVQSVAEARVVIRNRRRRTMSPKAVVERIDNGLVARGHTVLLRDPASGVDGRYLIATKHRAWGDATDPMPRALYRLEAWGEVA